MLIWKKYWDWFRKQLKDSFDANSVCIDVDDFP